MKEVAAEWVRVETLRPWTDNPRTISQAAVRSLAKVIRRFGWGAPIVARRADRMVIAGHRRLRVVDALRSMWAKASAAKRGEWHPEAVRVVEHAEVPVRFVDLSESDARKLALIDNREGEETDWDLPKLGELLAEMTIGEIEEVGFDLDEVAELRELSLEGDAEAPDVVEVETPDLPADPVTRPGDLWILGEHRLLCGDSTSAEDLARLMAGVRADMLFTDPPYGVAYQSRMAGDGTRSKFELIENDDLDAEALEAFLRQVFGAAASVTRAGAAAYVCHSDQKAGLRPAFEAAFLSSGYELGGCLVWVKPSASMGWQDYRNRYEPILYGWMPGAERRRVTDRTETTVWEIRRDAASSYKHPTQKPVALPARALRNSTVEGDLVLDLFGGAGCTLLAAEQLDRQARVMELKPGYCDVIVERWEGLTGQKARRESVSASAASGGARRPRAPRRAAGTPSAPTGHPPEPA